MSITRYPHGISSFGVPVFGGISFGMSNDSKIYFVDANGGSDGNTGEEPAEAFATIYKAVTVANAWDVIYIIPKNWTSGNLWLGTAYQETTDLSIAYAKHGIAMVGVAHQALRGRPTSVVIREKASSTEAIVKVHAPMCAFENLAFENQSTAVNGLYMYGDVAGTSEAALTTVYNCHFHGCNGSGATGDTGGAVYSHAAWGTTVDSCSFLGCRIGVSLKSDAATSGNMTVIRNIFYSRLTSASDISADIYVYTQGSASLLVADNYCAHLIPSYSGGHSRYIVTADVRQGVIANNHTGGVQGTTLTTGSAGTGISCNNNVGHGANYTNGALMAEST